MKNHSHPIACFVQILKPLLALFLGCALLMIVGCATSAKKLSYLSPGMSKEEVRKVLGDPTSVPGPGVRQQSPPGLLEVWEYLLDNGTEPDLTYWMIFTDGKLTDWRETKDCEKIRQILKNR